MGRRRIQIIIELLHILAVIALAVSQTKKPFLQNRIVAVPKRQRKAKTLHGRRETAHAILAPAIGAAARMFVRKIFPCRAVGTIILAHRAPLPFGKVRAPALPFFLPGIRFV